MSTFLRFQQNLPVRKHVYVGFNPEKINAVVDYWFSQDFPQVMSASIITVFVQRHDNLRTSELDCSAMKKFFQNLNHRQQSNDLEVSFPASTFLKVLLVSEISSRQGNLLSDTNSLDLG